MPAGIPPHYKKFRIPAKVCGRIIAYVVELKVVKSIYFAGRNIRQVPLISVIFALWF
jgi:hypothetical protein